MDLRLEAEMTAWSLAAQKGEERINIHLKIIFNSCNSLIYHVAFL
jgi:hypothetical protein